RSGAVRKGGAVKVATKPTKDDPTARVAFDPAKADVGDLARAVAGAQTPDREKGAPSATLVLAYERLDGSAVADEAYLPGKVEKALANLKGVDAKKSKIDFKKRQLLIRLDDKGGARLSHVKKGFGGPQLST